MANYFDRIVLAEERVAGAVSAFIGTPLLISGAKRISEKPLKVAMAPQDWAFGVVFPLNHGTEPRETLEVVVARFEVVVSAGDIRVGCVDPASAFFLGDEMELAARDEPQSVDVEIPLGAGSVVFRTGLTKESVAPILQINDCQIVIGKRVADVSVVDVPCGSFHDNTKSANSTNIDGVQLLVSHSTRRFDHARASADFLRERYANTERFSSLPPFETLSSASTARSLHGALTYFQIGREDGSLSLNAIRCIDSRELIQQAAVIGGKLVICSNGFLCVLPNLEYELCGDEFDATSKQRIDDPWFAGLHTVVGIDEDTCLVSAAGPDAVLWVDLKSRRVTRRFRLPESRYGRNYDLTPNTAVNEHYITNDYQLGHLNSAYPDDSGGCYFTTLGQGDIAHVDKNDTFELLASGYVGLHGLRRSFDGTFLYFSESPTGRLWKVANEKVSLIASIRTDWLHDSQQIAANLFACLRSG